MYICSLSVTGNIINSVAKLITDILFIFLVCENYSPPFKNDDFPAKTFCKNRLTSWS